MSSSPATSSTTAVPTTVHADFTDQLVKLRRQQEEQYVKLTQQYREQQDMLKQQQQQELKQYYKRQMIANANREPPSSNAYVGYHPERKPHDHIMDDKMLEEQQQQQPGTSSNSSSSALSALVRDRVRKKALDNINKKSAFEHFDARAFTMRRQEEFNRWVCESRPYDKVEEDDLIPLRKAASEPNLKGRNQFKHRVRYKPCVDHHPLVPGNHPRHSYSPIERHSEMAMSTEHREAISPPYKPTVEGRVFSQGPRGKGGVAPLFQSPSLPNINLNSSRSQVHFPTSMSLGSYPSGSNPELKAPLHPGHPKYLDMLKTQYATNHRYLQHIMLEHGHDPKEIDVFHQRYLKTEDHRMSDEDRVKQLLESQNKLYLHLVDLFKLSVPSSYTGMSKSYSKLHSIETVPPPSTSLIQSRSHDSLHNIKSPPHNKESSSFYKEDYLLQPHGLHSQHPFRFRFNRDPYQIPTDLHHSKDHTAARLRLKEHILREKHDATTTAAATMKQQHSLDSHFRRLEQDHKIQEETEEDVAKEERKHISPGGSQENIYKRSTESILRKPDGLRKMDSDTGSRSSLHGSRSSLHGSNSRLHTLTAKMHSGSNPQLYGSNASLHGSNSRIHTSNPHIYSSDSHIRRSNPRLNGSDPYLTGPDPTAHGSDPRLHGSDPRLHGSDPRMIALTSTGDATMKNTKEMTGLIYDTIMLKHHCSCGGSYPEHPESSGRLQSIWARLQETGVANLCERIRPRKATIAELQTVHSEQHTILFGGGANTRGSQNLRCFTTLTCGGTGVDNDTIWNETHTANAARMAAGCVIELAFKIASGDLKNGFAIVRPPGHHAEAHQAMKKELRRTLTSKIRGFCYFNSISIAAKLLCMKVAAERIMIIDWDIHHGNGTQQMFYDDDRVLYLSMHRHDDGEFFPGTGKLEECGAGMGMGCNVNIPFNGGLEPIYGDKEYLAALRVICLPILKEFKPDIVLVSAGYDAADGHSPQLGGYNVTPACFAYMTKQLMEHSNGKVLLALEGGYALQSLCDCAENCVRALLGKSAAELTEDAKLNKPHDNCVKSLEKVAEIQGKYWPGIKRASAQISKSHNEAKKMEKEEADTVNALASLSMRVVQNGTPSDKSPEEVSETREEEPMES